MKIKEHNTCNTCILLQGGRVAPASIIIWYIYAHNGGLWFNGVGVNEWMHAYSLKSWMLVGDELILFIDSVSVSLPISVWGYCFGVRHLAAGGICICVLCYVVQVGRECVVLVLVFGCCRWYLFLWCVGWFRLWLWWGSIACFWNVGGVRDSWCGVCLDGVCSRFAGVWVWLWWSMCEELCWMLGWIVAWCGWVLLKMNRWRWFLGNDDPWFF